MSALGAKLPGGLCEVAGCSPLQENSVWHGNARSLEGAIVLPSQFGRGSEGALGTDTVVLLWTCGKMLGSSCKKGVIDAASSRNQVRGLGCPQLELHILPQSLSLRGIGAESQKEVCFAKGSCAHRTWYWPSVERHNSNGRLHPALV